MTLPSPAGKSVHQIIARTRCLLLDFDGLGQRQQRPAVQSTVGQSVGHAVAELSRI